MGVLYLTGPYSVTFTVNGILSWTNELNGYLRWMWNVVVMCNTDI
jgi:hypothetical protein